MERYYSLTEANTGFVTARETVAVAAVVKISTADAIRKVAASEKVCTADVIQKFAATEKLCVAKIKKIYQYNKGKRE